MILQNFCKNFYDFHERILSQKNFTLQFFFKSLFEHFFCVSDFTPFLNQRNIQLETMFLCKKKLVSFIIA